MPYSPPEYSGPTFEEAFDWVEAIVTSEPVCVDGVCTPAGTEYKPRTTTIGEPISGFGKPMSYIYEFPTISGDGTNLLNHRSFGAFGVSDTVDTDANGDIFNAQGAKLG